MGQRLNLEIKNKGEALANSYYHWSGYSTSSLYHTLEAINDYKDGDENVKDAIRLLNATGARITKESWDYGAEQGLFEGEYVERLDRNNGLIGITPKEIDETRKWEEGRVTINLDTKTIDFDCCWDFNKEEFESEVEKEAVPMLAEGIENRHKVPFDKVEYLLHVFSQAEEHNDGVVKIGDELVSSIY